MKVFSASEAVWPALERTYAYLFRPFKAETFLKLAAVATISEGFVVSFHFSVPNAFPFEIDTGALRSILLAPDFLPVTILGAMALFLTGVYCLYLVIRLRFAFIHSLIHQTRGFRDAARLYFVEAERFYTAIVLVWLSFLVVVAVAIVLFMLTAYTVVSTRTPEGKLDPGNFLILFFPSAAIVFTLLLAMSVAQIVLNDFILPHMAIEGAPFSRAWAEVRLRMAAHKETFASYFVLRLAMPLIAGVILGVVAWFIGFMVFGILGMSAAGFTAMLDGVPGLRAYLLIAVQMFFVLVGLGVGLVIAVCVAGPIGVFMRSYALFFYGGHYKALGNLLNPPASAPAAPDPATGYP